MGQPLSRPLGLLHSEIRIGLSIFFLLAVRVHGKPPHPFISLVCVLCGNCCILNFNRVLPKLFLLVYLVVFVCSHVLDQQLIQIPYILVICFVAVVRS